MTSRAQIEDTIRSLWAARVRGDLEGTLKDVAENAAFSVNARGTGEASLSGRTTGKAAIRPVLRQLIETWRFDDWKQVSLLIDGEKALLHWTARVTCVPTGKSENFDVFDLITFQDDKIVDCSTAAEAARLLPQGHYLSIPQCGHAPQMEKPWLINRLVVHFLSSPRPSTNLRLTQLLLAS